MYIYNTSFMVEAPVHDRWLALVRDKYIPFLKKEGFDRITLSRILSPETAGQLTYSLQVRVAEIPDYQRWTGSCSPNTKRSRAAFSTDRCSISPR